MPGPRLLHRQPLEPRQKLVACVETECFPDVDNNGVRRRREVDTVAGVAGKTEGRQGGEHGAQGTQDSGFEHGWEIGLGLVNKIYLVPSLQHFEGFNLCCKGRVKHAEQ